MSKELKPYPTWVCRHCGLKAMVDTTAYPDKNPVSTWHIDKCDICGKETDVTEPRDFHYPKFEGHKEE